MIDADDPICMVDPIAREIYIRLASERIADALETEIQEGDLSAHMKKVGDQLGLLCTLSLTAGMRFVEQRQVFLDEETGGVLSEH